jgi:hypothetical protein
MAKRYPDRVTLDVDDEGRITFRFPNAPWSTSPHVRVETTGYGVRVEVPAEPVGEMVPGEAERRAGTARR